MKRLTARTETGHAYLVNVKPDEQEVDSPHKNTLQCILDCFERLAQYEDAEEQGRCVVLPCNVGDTVYMVSAVGCGDNVYHCDKPCNGTWENCNSHDESLRIDEIPFSYFRIPDIGKTVFLTRAEAEAALKGAEHE